MKVKLTPRLLFGAAAFAILAGCSSATKQAAQDAAVLAEFERTTSQQYGGVQVKLNSKGDWVEISSTDSVSVGLDAGPDLQMAAMRLALAHAKQNIVAYLGSNVGYNTISKTYRRGDNVEVHSNESISDYGNALIRGLVVDKMTVEGDRAVVRVVVRKTEMSAAKRIRLDMLK